MASPLPGLEAVMSGSSVQACPPDVWLWLAAPVCSGSLRSGRKWEENIQCTDARQKPNVMGLLITRVYPLLAEQAGGDGAWQGRERGAEETPQLLRR